MEGGSRWAGSEGGKKGVAGEKGAFAVLRCVFGRGLGKKTSGVGRDMVESGDFGGKTMQRERSFPVRSAKISLGSGFLEGVLQAFRCRRELEFGRPRVGFLRVARQDSDRRNPGRIRRDSGDG